MKKDLEKHSDDSLRLCCGLMLAADSQQRT